VTDVCTIEGCQSPRKAKGLCRRHYQQQWATGSPEIKRPNPRGTTLERFWRHVDKKSDDECWPWTAFCDKDGYGKFRVGNTSIGAHRFSYMTFIGPLNEDQKLLHKCNNPPCVNPNHTKPGTHFENMEDRLKAGNYARGEKHPMAKFSDAAVLEIKASTETYRQISLRFGISESQIGNIKRGAQRSNL
jgi:hypothetical protein